MSNIEIAALYHFAALPHFEQLQAPLQGLFKTHNIKGILLLAHEGINGTIAGTPQELAAALKGTAEITGLNFEYKISYHEKMPFRRMKVRLKKEIVTIGDPNVSPINAVGTYVNPQDWNDIISDPEVLLLDTRNDYEYRIGTFKGAIDPNTATFREFPEFVRQNYDPKIHKKVAMFCTGGIRCEKASAFMLQEGFETVYHLKGGILKYLEQVPIEKSLWDGACFVFDERVAVEHGLEATQNFTLCYGCREPISTADMQHADFEFGVSCPHCAPKLTQAHRHAARERQRQIKRAQELGIAYMGREADVHTQH